MKKLLAIILLFPLKLFAGEGIVLKNLGISDSNKFVPEPIARPIPPDIEEETFVVGSEDEANQLTRELKKKKISRNKKYIIHYQEKKSNQEAKGTSVTWRLGN